MHIVCADDVTIEIDDKLATLSVTLRNCVSDAEDDADDEVNLMFDSTVINIVVNYMKEYRDVIARWAESYSEELTSADRKMFAMTATELIPIINAAKYLVLPSLVCVAGRLVGEQINAMRAAGKIDELLNVLELPNDPPSQEETEELYNEVEWLKHVPT